MLSYAHLTPTFDGFYFTPYLPLTQTTASHTGTYRTIQNLTEKPHRHIENNLQHARWQGGTKNVIFLCGFAKSRPIVNYSGIVPMSIFSLSPHADPLTSA